MRNPFKVARETLETAGAVLSLAALCVLITPRNSRSVEREINKGLLLGYSFDVAIDGAHSQHVVDYYRSLVFHE